MWNRYSTTGQQRRCYASKLHISSHTRSYACLTNFTKENTATNRQRCRCHTREEAKTNNRTAVKRKTEKATQLFIKSNMVSQEVRILRPRQRIGKNRSQMHRGLVQLAVLCCGAEMLGGDPVGRHKQKRSYTYILWSSTYTSTYLYTASSIHSPSCIHTSKPNGSKLGQLSALLNFCTHILFVKSLMNEFKAKISGNR